MRLSSGILEGAAFLSLAGYWFFWGATSSFMGGSLLIVVSGRYATREAYQQGTRLAVSKGVRA